MIAVFRSLGNWRIPYIREGVNDSLSSKVCTTVVGLDMHFIITGVAEGYDIIKRWRLVAMKILM